MTVSLPPDGPRMTPLGSVEGYEPSNPPMLIHPTSGEPVYPAMSGPYEGSGRMTTGERRAALLVVVGLLVFIAICAVLIGSANAGQQRTELLAKPPADVDAVTHSRTAYDARQDAVMFSMADKLDELSRAAATAERTRRFNYGLDGWHEGLSLPAAKKGRAE